MTTPKFKPLLAATVEDTSTLAYPLYASVKLDGIRMIVLDSVCYSRSMKPIRSKAVQKLFGKPEYNGLDGELLYGPWNAHNVFNLTTQACMATELKEGFKEAEITFAVFDGADRDSPYKRRKEVAKYVVESFHISCQLRFVEQQLVYSEQELKEYEDKALLEGYEGVMVRSLSGAYKQGRSTLKDGIIGKIKRFNDDEAIVLGFEEKLTNTNEAKVNELGRTQRSQAQEGMVGAGTLGAIICECKGIKFTMGSGFDDAMRKEVWENKDKYIGKLAKFKYFAVGMLISYRFPVFISFRHEDDLGE